jgi:hypothetical protein
MEEISEKEKQFSREYLTLLEKYNVRLIMDSFSDEYGTHTSLSFVEKGKYSNINYQPDYRENNQGYSGMGR